MDERHDIGHFYTGIDILKDRWLHVPGSARSHARDHEKAMERVERLYSEWRNYLKDAGMHLE